MKKIFAFFVAASLYVTVLAQENPYLTKSLANETVREVLSRTSGGGISVSGVSSEARVEVYIRSERGTELSKAEIEKKLKEEYDLIVSVSGNKLTATAERKNDLNWRQSLNISFKIFVPQNVSTDLHTSGGGIDLTNLSGTHDFSTSGGGLHLSALSGKTNGKTSGGGITVTDTKGEIRLHTSGGGIEATNCSGQINLKTSGGSIRLSRMDGAIDAETSGGPVRGNDIKGELRAHTSGGGIVLNGLACSLDASTSGGNMEVEIKELGKYVNVSNSGGNINLEMPGNKGLDLNLRGTKIKVTSLNNFSGDQEDERITGKINGGGIPVDVRTSGNITFALK